MTNTILDEPKVRAWIKQFGFADQANAATLVSLVKLIPGDRFRLSLTKLLDERWKAGALPVALYNESERKKWNGQPHRLFPEKSRANPLRKGKKIVRAIGKNGPALVPRQRSIAEEVGSEGIVANIITQFNRTHRKDVLLSPGPDIIRQKRVRRFILVTDFIGSGDRISTYLDAAWRISSVRSWWARRDTKGIKFEIIAYAGTTEGVDHIKSHPSAPQVFLVGACPTISTSFPPAQATIMNELCERYAPKDTEPLGYGASGVLLAFDHGMPNNSPSMLWKSTGSWTALVPGRSTIAVGSPFHLRLTEEQEQSRLEAAARASATGPQLAPVNLEAIVLSALRRSPRNVEAISGRLGIEIVQVEDTLLKLQKWGWINGDYHITDRGRLMTNRLIKHENMNPLPSADSTLYFPKMLRTPRDV